MHVTDALETLDLCVLIEGWMRWLGYWEAEYERTSTRLTYGRETEGWAVV